MGRRPGENVLRDWGDVPTGGWEGGLDQVLSLSPQEEQLSRHTWSKASGLTTLRKEGL